MTEERRPAGAERLLEIRDGIAGGAETLAEETEKLGFVSHTKALRLLVPRLRQGLVRVAVIGATSSGKSTLLNALLERITVPENPNVSSPIPVWIGYGGEAAFTVYEESGEDAGGIICARYPAETFLKRYCYSLSDTADRDMDRFSRVRYGAVSLPSPCLAGGGVLIDTLGISASKLDTGKTNAVLEEGVDLVIFVSSNSSGNNEYTKAEADFLRLNIMGLNPKDQPEKRKVTHPVKPENILFVHNVYDTDVSPAYQAMEANLDRVLKGFPPEVVADVKARNVFFVQALMGRYLSCGAYSYIENAPDNCREEELRGLEDWEWQERETMARFSREELEERSGIGRLRQSLLAHVARLCRGPASAAAHRIGELDALAKGVQLAASDRLNETAAGLAELQRLKEDCAGFSAAVEERKKRIRRDMEQYESRFISGLGRSYAACLEKIKDQVTGLVYTEMGDAPEDFSIRWNEYKQWTELQKQAYIQKFLPPLMGRILQTCSDRIDEMISYDSGRDDDAMVVLEASRQYILNESKQAALFQEKLKSLGVSEADSFTVAADILCGALSSRLEERLKAAVNNSLATTGAAFEARINARVQKLDWKGFWGVLPHGQKKFWHRVRDKILRPLAVAAVEDLEKMTNPGEHGTASALTAAVMKAYQDVTLQMQDIMTSLLTAVDFRVAAVARQIETGEALTAEEKKNYQSIQNSCKEIRAALDGWMNELLA